MRLLLGRFGLLFLVALVWVARDLFAFPLSNEKVHAGDYEGGISRLRWLGLGMPSVTILHAEGLALALSGRPAEAEQRYRRALAKEKKSAISPRDRLMACLGFALTDLGRYDEAERTLQAAIDAGDRTGNSHDGLAELRLVQGIEADKALDLVQQAIGLARVRPGRRIPPSYFANQAWALALLRRGPVARQAIGEAEKSPGASFRASLASMRWRIGMALAAMGRAEESLAQFRLGHEADPRGKYGASCLEQIKLHGGW